MKKEVGDILRYWYKLEFFSPYKPKKNTKGMWFSQDKIKIPWMKKEEDERYIVYLGMINVDDIITKMINLVGLDKQDKIEKDNSEACICAFKIDNEGKYIEGSFCLSTFAWAIAQIIICKDINTGLEIERYNKMVQNINTYLISIENMNKETLVKCFEYICNQLGNEIAQLAIMKGIINVERVPKQKEDEKEEEQDNAVDMLSSFYISDLKMLIEKNILDSKVEKYIGSLLQKEENKIEIDKDAQNMRYWLHPSKYPKGKWPSKFSPSLMQQIAINIAISDESMAKDIFSVNGPPGTGKTTLLKEIISSNIVERAYVMSEYSSPDDAFSKVDFIKPFSEHIKYYYKLDDRLKRYGMLVASNNNAAVENISKELPIKKSVEDARCPLFKGNEELYFTDMANRLMENSNSNEPCWAFLSARMGNKSNINTLKSILWFDKEVNLRVYLDSNEPLDWRIEKEAYKEKYKQVENKRKELCEIADKVVKQEYIYKELEEMEENLAAIQGKLNEAKEKYQALYNKIEERDNDIKSIENIIEELVKDLNIIERIFKIPFGNTELLSKWKEKKKDKAVALIEKIKLKEELQRLENEKNDIEQKREKQQARRDNKKAEYGEITKELEISRNKLGKNFITKEFWNEVDIDKEKQLISPWTDEEYDLLREELFYQALRVHKAFIMNAKDRLKQNLKCFINKDQMSIEEIQQAYGESLNSLFLVVPVLSTTFASIFTFLENVKENEIALLIVDEAGQATPQSAVGAIWRSKKVMIVGDPLQVEPVSGIPRELIKRFAEEYNIKSEYKSEEISVQVLADNINPYGGFRQYTGEKLWVGCPLVVHRRCIYPMFDISNIIAYNRKMFQETKLPKEDIILSMGKSKWISVKGREKGGKNHYVEEQGQKAAELVLNAFKVNHNSFPELFIISPFTSVVGGLKEKISVEVQRNLGIKKQEIDEWLEESCSTVHKFQGKEANEVILVLGCDENEGMGAAHWVGKKPNIVNVAVTRAKYRVSIIGDEELWKKVSYVRDTYKYLK